MRNLLAYSGLVTKIKAMSSHLITPKEYEEISFFTSVTEVVAFLKKHPAYQEIFRSIDEATLHRGEVELRLENTIQEHFSKIYRFSNMEQRRFMDIYFRRYEIALLKYLLRSVFDKHTVSRDFSALGSFFSRHSSIDVAKLSAASTIEELIEGLRDSIYHMPLSHVKNASASILFDYEMALDLFYFTSLWKTIQKSYKGDNLKILKETLGAKLDMLNIQWIYRSKKYYHMTAADIYSLIIPVHYKLNAETVKQMAEAESAEALIGILKNNYYGRHFQEIDADSIEKMYRLILNKLYTLTERKYSYSIACINTYLYRKENEIDRLTSIIEGIRYGLPPEQILKII